MNAVWLSDELCVSPSAVAGLISLSEDDSYGPTYGLSRSVSIVLLSGVERHVWEAHAEVPIGAGGEQLKTMLRLVRAEQRAAAEAEMGRLSGLLWPAEPGKGWVFNEMPNYMAIHDPELWEATKAATAVRGGVADFVRLEPPAGAPDEPPTLGSHSTMGVDDFVRLKQTVGPVEPVAVGDARWYHLAPLSVLNIIGAALAWESHPHLVRLQEALREAVRVRRAEVAEELEADGP